MYHKLLTRFLARVNSMALRKIGFVGLGNMGYGMARNVARTALVSAFDGDVAIGPKLAAEVGRVEAAADVAGAARGADAVVTSLPSNDAVRAVYLGPGGVLEALAAGSACVDTSTVDPAVSREVAAAAAAKNITFLDAPVSGGVPAADAGTLTFMVGGDAADVEAARPLLESMGARVIHCGGVGAGGVAKLCNNLVLAISMLGVSEATNLGDRLGVSPAALNEVLSTSTARCWSCDTYHPAPGVTEASPANRDYAGGFAAKLMRKDLGLAAGAAAPVAAEIPLGSAALAFYDALCEGGYADKDFSVAFKYLREK